MHDAIIRDVQSGVISWEKLILDIHAGRFLGVMGVLFMDLVAVIFMLLAATGTFIWFKKRDNRRRQ